MYSAAVAVATYPGTVSPLRGLDPFGEAERDVWHGREAERDEIAKLVIADGFRAGLLYGEPGVGKTSLVRAGLIPHLRDHGIVALACEDYLQPAASFAAGLSAFGIQPTAGELPLIFVTRAVSAAVAGQQFVFVIDDIDLLCGDERATVELSDLFARVVSRSRGHARFLFVCTSERQHMLGSLEKRTGSLFPPSTRYELNRLQSGEAIKIFDRMLSLSGIAADPALAEAVVQSMSRGRPVLPSDLQIAAMAMRDLRITSQPALVKAGGGSELESAWLHEACRATGNQRSALRLCAELAAPPGGPRSSDAIIRRINLDAQFAHHAFGVLEQRGVIVRGDPDATSWMLRHEVLVTRVRELTAPARAAARRGFDLLGSKTKSHERLSLRELYALHHEGIAAVTAEEREVVERSKRYYLVTAGAIAAAPLILLIIIWIAMRGNVYFDLQPDAGGDRVKVRYGRAGLSAFHWLPGGFGDEVADTGMTRPMVAPEVWNKIEDHDLGADDDEWGAMMPTVMAPQLAGLVAYATTGDQATLEALRKAVEKDPEDLAELLAQLRPIARGIPSEVALIVGALKLPSPAVQRAAIATAGAAAQRGSDAYREPLRDALVSPEAELRRIAFARVRSLGERGRALFADALGQNPDAAIRRELMVEVASVASEDAPSIGSALTTLQDAEALPSLRERAKIQIRGALAKDPVATATTLTKLVADERAAPELRLYAIETLRDLDPLPQVAELVEAARSAFGSRSVAVRAAALPLYAKADPVRAGGDLAAMLEDTTLDRPMQVAAALAWGEVAASNKGAAENALDRMLKSDNKDIRAAAAEAAGKLGRTYQDQLVKMAKADYFDVQVGAARGLAATAASGASVNVAMGGIYQLWKQKGRLRREAAKVYAQLAKTKPQPVVDQLRIASRIKDDPALRVIGVDGLCNAALAGNATARAGLTSATGDESVEVRKLVMACVADGPDAAKNGAGIAARLVEDSNGEIRADAARVLALSASKGASKEVGEALVKLLDDPDRDVRVIAARAIGGLGAEAPKTAPAIMGKRFERADEPEKLALLRAARQIGAAELIAIGVADSSPQVRVEAVDAALASGQRAAETLSAALADFDPQVRKAALERLAAQKDKLEPAVIQRTLALAVRDPNPELSQLALTTVSRVAAKDAVVARLRRSLGSRAERDRAQAAAAAVGLVDRDAALAAQLLEPLLSDPSHDVRVAMLPALGAAYAKTNQAEKLASLLEDAETNAMTRLVVAAAFVTLAKSDAGRAATESTLGKVAKEGPPLARATAKLVIGLIAGRADGLAFLQELVP